MKQSGEISAIIGYNKQYEVCAIEIYKELLNNNLEWVEFASNNSGKLDDVLIGCKDYIKAFQVKDIDGNFTYSKLITPSKEMGKSIIDGCFEGWKSLKNKYNKDIIGKYISNEKPSSHDKITLFKGDEKPSFSVFLTKFWNFLKMNPIESLDDDWKPVLDNLTRICKAENTEFIDFNNSFEFVLDNEYNVQEQIYDYNGYQRKKDIEKISKNIFKIIGTRGNVKFDRKTLLNEFDLLERYETYFQHSFFVDEEHYQPITETIQELEKTINKSSNGYIAIIGNAGSGKSTLLTKWINEKNDRVLKYYAYVNKEMDYDFIGFVDGYKNQMSRLEYICKIHGKQNVSYHNFVNHGTRCGGCTTSGYSTSKQGTFYIYQWTKDNHSFIKFGITNRKELSRIKQQKRETEYKYKKIWSATFINGNIPKLLEDTLT